MEAPEAKQEGLGHHPSPFRPSYNQRRPLLYLFVVHMGLPSKGPLYTEF